MHDIGRTQQEYLGEAQEFQPEAFEFGGTGEVYGETLGESFEAGLHETGTFETFEPQELPVNEALEMELASELLEVTSEEELDRFLGSLIRKATGAVGKFIRSPLGRTLGGLLKPLAKKFLPIAGGALGTFGGPLGGMVGGKLANLAGRAFGLELEGMSSEDAQFEVARRFVRFGSAAANNAASAPPSADPRTTAQVAVTTAAQRHAPGLLPGGALTTALPTEPAFSPVQAPSQQEARALLTRLSLVKPFALHETMVLAASVPIPAQAAIEAFLAKGRRQLAQMVHGFIRWLRAGGGFRIPISEVQRQFTFLRLRFNAVLTQFDIFAAVMTQRSQSEIGVWLSGLDVASADAISLPGDYYTPPPIAVGRNRPDLGELLSFSRPRPAAPANLRAAGRHDAGIRQLAGDSSAPLAARQVASRSLAGGKSPAVSPARTIPGLARFKSRHVRG